MRKSYLLRAFLLLLICHVKIRVGQFGAVRRWVADCPVSSRQPHLDSISLAVYVVNRAAAFFPRQSVCLSRAAVITILLRKLGFPAAMIIGVRRLPFASHAWVALHGEPLAMYREESKTYTLLDIISPKGVS